MTGPRNRAESTLAAELDARDADAFVHVGRARDPAIRYCAGGDDPEPGTIRALAFDGESWRRRGAAPSDAAHPATALASALADAGAERVLSPRAIPHDAALYFEGAGLELASTDALERARARKTPAEVERIERAQAAASEGLRRAASTLAGAAVVDGALRGDDEALTPERLRREIDREVVAAGASPADGTAVSAPGTGPLRAGEPIVVSVAPREPGGYRGALVRTLVVDGEGGPERRAHVAITHAFRSARALLTADVQSVTAVEADLEAEVRAFGFAEDDGIETRVRGVGLDPVERPARGDDEVGPGSVVRLDVAVGTENRVRLADLLVVEADGPRTLAAPARSLEPAAAFEV
ncbi:peptidase M24 [Salinilacihabitans rarus]|uniref:peptidase M24 n=1 Tax=Salinilacihabitans rarus TaxID=2961596 RepID=UPI0020C8804B|nr:peptidase M24 [Salinilacihabitans rarus]